MTLFDPDTHARGLPDGDPEDDALLERWLSQPTFARRPPSLPPRGEDGEDAGWTEPIGDAIADTWFK